MKRTISFILLLATLLSLVGCKGGDEAPDGMQLVRGSDAIGYYFYAPEEWTVSNLGNISAAYASNVDSSSITYTETAMPKGTVDEYFKESLSEFTFPIQMVCENEETVFGNATNASMYVYDYTYSEHKFRTKQIFASYGERFGIFTYTSMLENLSSPDKLQYDFYEEKIRSVTDNFKFVDKTGSEDKPLYEYGDDGYALVSDKKVAKFSLYLPKSFTPDYSSGIVSATSSDGSNITLSRVAGAGVGVGEYLNHRLEELSAICSEITVIEAEDESGERHAIDGNATLGNANAAAAQEYTFVYNGTKYHVYQICAVTFFNGFVFTYTATEENYAAHIDEILEITKRVEF